MQHHVFISYKVEEFDQALAVRDYLEQQGITCWMAPMSIRGGMSYAQEIPQAIEGCGVFVLILSEKAQLSKWVPRELDQAINCGKVILPYMLENCPLRNDFSFYLTNVQRYDAFRDPEGTLARMADDICRMFHITPPPKPEEERPPEPPKVTAPPKPKKEKKPAGKRKKFLLGGLCAVALLLVILVVSLLASMPGKLTIAGVEFEEDDFFVRLEDVTLTAADIAKFSQFEDLSVIHLERCTIEPQDLSNLVSDDLMVLEIRECNLTDSQFSSIDFTEMRHFSELYVSGNPGLTDISSVAIWAEKLTRLEFSDTGVQELDWLKNMTKLEILRADRIGLQDLSVLEGMIYLEELSLSGNGITSLEGLKNTSKLTEVDLSNNALTDVSVLSRSAGSLAMLHLENNALTDLSCLAEATGLKKVYVDGNQLTDLAWLKGKEELVILSASNNRIVSLSKLRIGSKLRYLNLADNLLTIIEYGDLSFGEGNFLMVELQNNSLTKVDLPEGCTYKQLVLLGNPRLDLHDLRYLKGWNVYFDFPPGVELQTLKELAFSNLCMVGCPLDRRVEMEEGLSNEAFMTMEEVLEEIQKRAMEADY